MEKSRYIWIDCVKLLACIMVAIGHLLQSFIEPGIIHASAAYQIFDRSIYTFHVPLFFICSGFLYQRYSKVDSIESYAIHARKKLRTIAVPYLVFTTFTWVLKRILSNEVNKNVGGFLDAVFVRPIMQYWYLYCLIILFLAIPTAKSKRISAVLLSVAFGLKVISIVHQSAIYAVSTVLDNAFWYVSGMCLCTFDACRLFKKRNMFVVSIMLMLMFVCCCTVPPNEWSGTINFVCGLLACAGIVLFVGCCCERCGKAGLIRNVSRYTMPIYLMHTIFAAAGRIILLKLGVRDLGIHIAAGMLLSFVAPVLAASVMLRTKALSWILGVRLHPDKF